MKQTLKTTTHRGTFNKLHKQNLEAVGKIRCSWCSYHNGDNFTNVYYGELDPELKMYTWTLNYRYNDNEVTYISHPSWKLRYRGRKSWDKSRERSI